MTLSPTSLSFPTQIVFTNSKVQTATLNNTGLGYLYITNIAATGPFTQINNCGCRRLSRHLPISQLPTSS